MAALRPILVALVTLGVVWGGVVLVGHLTDEGGADGDAEGTGGPERVVTAALSALAQGNLAGVRPYLTEDGWRQLQRDMRLFRTELEDPKKREKQRELAVNELSAAAWDAAVKRVIAGDESDAWRLLSRLYPMDDPPKLAGVGIDPKQPERMSFHYWGPTKHRRRVDLIREHGVWKIRFISLL